ncbi:10759_t:CDS:2, partial [Funneliformis mosseae]
SRRAFGINSKNIIALVSNRDNIDYTADEPVDLIFNDVKKLNGNHWRILDNNEFALLQPFRKDFIRGTV